MTSALWMDIFSLQVTAELIRLSLKSSVDGPSQLADHSKMKKSVWPQISLSKMHPAEALQISTALSASPFFLLLLLLLQLFCRSRSQHPCRWCASTNWKWLSKGWFGLEGIWRRQCTHQIKACRNIFSDILVTIPTTLDHLVNNQDLFVSQDFRAVVRQSLFEVAFILLQLHGPEHPRPCWLGPFTCKRNHRRRCNVWYSPAKLFRYGIQFRKCLGWPRPIVFE